MYYRKIEEADYFAKMTRHKFIRMRRSSSETHKTVFVYINLVYIRGFAVR